MKNIEEKIVKSVLYGRVMHFYFFCKKFQKVRITEKIFFYICVVIVYYQEKDTILFLLLYEKILGFGSNCGSCDELLR